MSIQWSVEGEFDLNVQVVLDRLSGLVTAVSGWRTLTMSCYEDRRAFIDGRPGSCRTHHVPAEGDMDTVVLGDHTVKCYVDLTKGRIEGIWYTMEARRDVLSPVVAILVAACVAEFGRVDVVDDSMVLGRRLIPPADILAPLENLPEVEGEDPERAAHRVAAAIGAWGLRIMQ